MKIDDLKRDPKVAGMADAFHDHLDACKQCADNPFALCPVGAQLIEKAAREILPVR